MRIYQLHRVALAFIISALAFPAVGHTAPASIDESFGKNGIVAFGGPSQHAASAQTGAGVVVVDGPRRIVRLLDSGAVDSSFGSGGSVALPKPAWISHVIERRGGGVWLVGSAREDELDLVIYALDGDGDMDLGFASAGCLQTGLAMRPQGVAVDEHGRLVIAGTGVSPAAPEATETGDTMVLRVAVAGQLDSAFGTGGIVLINRAPDQDDGASTVGIDAAGGAIVGLWSDANESEAHIALRLTESGARDVGFGSDGVALNSSGGRMTVDDLAIRPDGTILVIDGEDLGEPKVVALTAGGLADRSFGRDGVAVVGAASQASRPPFVERSVKIEVDAHGRVLVATSHGANGEEATDLTIARLTPSGRPDLAWGARGEVMLDVMWPLFGKDTLAGLHVDAVGRVVVVMNSVQKRHGKSSSANRVIRLTGVQGGAANPQLSLSIRCSRVDASCSGGASAVISARAAPSRAAVTVRVYRYDRQQEVFLRHTQHAFAYSGAPRRIDRLVREPGLYLVEVRIAATTSTRSSVARLRMRVK